MTKESSQMTSGSSQDVAELHRQAERLKQELAEIRRERDILVATLSSCSEESDSLRTDIADLLDELTRERQWRIESNALLLATAHALGLDSSDMGSLPQKAAMILAAGSVACQEWSERVEELEAELEQVRAKAQEQSEAVQRDWLSPVEAEGLRQKLAQAMEHIKGLDARITLEVTRQDELREAYRRVAEDAEKNFGGKS